jgi:Ser/Thr protein kinase RdoA (MazF antagonist)
LHAHARTFEPGANFSRVVWNSETLLTAEHGRFLSWRHADLDPALHPFLEDVNAALLESVRALERTGPRWLLHADLHQGNVLFLPNSANAIDFDDCGFGHPAVDIAVALGSPWADNYDAAWNALWAGYPEVTSELPFTREQVRLQCLTRTLQMIGWLADRGRDIPGLAKYAPKRLEIAIPHYRAWMKELGG